MKELLKALIAAKKTIKPIVKEAENKSKSKKYSYVTLSDLLAEIEPVLLENGLLISFCLQDGYIECTLWHSSGECMSSKTSIDIFVDSNGRQKEMEKPQRVGAAITYARKYLLMALLNISTLEPDADSDEYAQNSPNPTNPIYAKMTIEQLKELKRIMDSRNITKEKIIELAREVTGIEGIKSSMELPYESYEKLVKAIEEKFPSEQKLYY